MDLILWRHAEAVELREGEDDLQRCLTAKGERHAHRVAHWLNHVLPSTVRILVSPAARTQQTARALDRKFKTCDAIAPGCTVENLLETVRWPHAREPVLVVGHQPTLGHVAAHLVAGTPAGVGVPWRIKKAGVWWLRQREREQAEDESLITVVTVRSPDML